METGYELLLPEGILTYFEVTHADRTSTAILIYLDEKDLSGEERSGKHLQSKGFYPPASIHDFPSVSYTHLTLPTTSLVKV